jgi:hypothetical protein
MHVYATAMTTRTGGLEETKLGLALHADRGIIRRHIPNPTWLVDHSCNGSNSLIGGAARCGIY